MRRSITLAALAVTASLGVAPAVLADDVSAEVIASLAGDWLVAPDDGRTGCHITLQTDAAIGGYAVALNDDCAKSLPEIADAAAWRLSSGGLDFADATRKSILTFVEAEDATYATAAEPGKKLLLTKAPRSVNAVPTAKSLFGDWSVIGPVGKTICTLTLADKPPPGGEESYAVTISPDCRPRVVGMKLVSWKIENMKVMLYGAGGEGTGFVADGKGGYSTQTVSNEKPLRLAKP